MRQFSDFYSLVRVSKKIGFAKFQPKWLKLSLWRPKNHLFAIVIFSVQIILLTVYNLFLWAECVICLKINLEMVLNIKINKYNVYLCNGSFSWGFSFYFISKIDLRLSFGHICWSPYIMLFIFFFIIFKICVNQYIYYIYMRLYFNRIYFIHTFLLIKVG